MLLVTAASVLGGPARAPARASSGRIRPAPRTAAEDVSQPFHEGCMIGAKGTRTHGCVYGDRSAKRTVVLFGDSHALMHFPALQVLAKREHWRLLVWTKRECTPAETTIEGDGGGPYATCDAWRKAMLKQLEAEGGNATVVLTGESKTTALGPGGEPLRGGADAAAMERGYVATLRRIRHAGDRAVVVEDTPEAPDDVAECVAAHESHPASCDFAEPHRPDREFEVRAAKEVPGVRLVDLDGAICPHGRCRAVIDDVLVYRDEAHLTALFDATLAGRFEGPLRQAVGQ
jgi:hypothetical protein